MVQECLAKVYVLENVSIPFKSGLVWFLYTKPQPTSQDTSQSLLNQGWFGSKQGEQIGADGAVSIPFKSGLVWFIKRIKDTHYYITVSIPFKSGLVWFRIMDGMTANAEMSQSLLNQGWFGSFLGARLIN